MRIILPMLLLTLIAPAAIAADKRPNILLIASDDMAARIHCLGDPVAVTPNLDKLAARGVNFHKAYCQYPLCNPTRTSMLTGKYPTATGITDNNTWFRSKLPDVVTLPQLFRANGYVTARTGKIFHGGLDDNKAWMEGGENKPTGEGPKTKKQQVDRKATSDRHGPLDSEEDHGDYKSATQGITLLQKHKDETFFIAVGFAKPHSPLLAPRKYFDLYDPAKMPVPANFAATLTLPPGAPKVALTPSGDVFIDRPASLAEEREMLQAYYACISFCDAQVGRVLDEIDRLKLADNTIVIFFGDHGYHVGDKGKWSKHNSLYEPVARVPFILAGPHISAGKPCPRTVQFLDLYPTLVNICGLPRPDGLEGNDITPLLRDPAAPWDHPAITVCHRGDLWGKSIRDETHRYTEWNNGAEGVELYEYATDPDEMHNLAADPTQAPVIARLKKRLDESAVSRVR